MRINRKWDSDNGISKSRHSLRIEPITRSQMAFAFGLRGGVWPAKIESRTGRCEEILVMQSAKDRLGTDGVRFSAAMARIWMRVVAIDGRGIWDAWTQRHVRTCGIVVRNPEFQHGS